MYQADVVIAMANVGVSNQSTPADNIVATANVGLAPHLFAETVQPAANVLLIRRERWGSNMGIT